MHMRTSSKPIQDHGFCTFPLTKEPQLTSEKQSITDLVTNWRRDKTVVTTLRRGAMPLIMLHNSQIEPQSQLIYQISVKARYQL